LGAKGGVFLKDIGLVAPDGKMSCTRLQLAFVNQGETFFIAIALESLNFQINIFKSIFWGPNRQMVLDTLEKAVEYDLNLELVDVALNCLNLSEETPDIQEEEEKE